MSYENTGDVKFEDEMEDISDMEVQVNQMMTFTGIPKMQILTHVREELDKRRSRCSIVLLCYIVHALHLLQLLSRFRPNQICYGNPEREHRRAQLMRQLLETEKCRDVIRMSPQAFMQLCEKLRATGRVKDSTRSTVEEQVAKFLHIIGHNVKNRTMSFFFHRSGETISRHFHNVLRAIISLEGEFLVQPSGRDVPSEIMNNSRFYPYFKDCIGALDGTHIRVKVPRAEAPRFRGRKDYPTQNVFAGCDFGMKFTYVLPGWEGTASDSRILKDALIREDPLKIPEGKFYLGDAGFMLKREILTPYRGVRYHLKEYSARGPQNAKELFNHRHASLRNVIERCFGVLKKRFPILKSMSGFSWNPTSRKFEAEEEVWEDFIREKPYAAKWKKMQIKHYDILKDLFGADRATGKGATTAKERVQQWEKEPIDLNDSFEAMEMPDMDFNIGNETPYSTANLGSFSPAYGQSTQSGGTSGSRGTKRKAHMVDVVEAQYEKIASGINSVADALKEGNYFSNKLNEVAERQVTVAEKQVEIAEKGLAILQQSRPRHYSESDVWNMLTDLGVLEPHRMKCYRFLCGNEQKKRELFGIPPEMRLEALIQMMSEAGT